MRYKRGLFFCRLLMSATIYTLQFGAARESVADGRVCMLPVNRALVGQMYDMAVFLAQPREHGEMPEFSLWHALLNEPGHLPQRQRIETLLRDAHTGEAQPAMLGTTLPVLRFLADVLLPRYFEPAVPVAEATVCERPETVRAEPTTEIEQAFG